MTKEAVVAAEFDKISIHKRKVSRCSFVTDVKRFAKKKEKKRKNCLIVAISCI